MLANLSFVFFGQRTERNNVSIIAVEAKLPNANSSMKEVFFLHFACEERKTTR